MLIIFSLVLILAVSCLVYGGYVALFGHEAHGTVAYRDAKGREQIFQLDHCETVTGYWDFAVYDDGKNGAKIDFIDTTGRNDVNTSLTRAPSLADISVQLIVDGKILPWRWTDARSAPCQVKNSTLTFTPGNNRQNFLRFGGVPQSFLLARFAYWDGALDAECVYRAVTSTVHVDIRGCE